LAVGDNAVCTITNTKQPKLTVNKIIVPSTDTGKFNLQIDGSTAGTGADAGNGGTTGAVKVSAASHTVGETAGTGTTLSDYVATYSCSINGGGATTSSSVTLAAGDNAVCTITNSRQAKLTVNKIIVPSTD